MYCSSIALKDGQEVLWSDIFSSVVNLAASIDILAIGFVEDLARERILRILGNIIIRHDDDV